MAVNKDHLPTPVKAKIWSHLSHLHKDLMPLVAKLVYLLDMIAQKLLSQGKLLRCRRWSLCTEDWLRLGNCGDLAASLCHLACRRQNRNMAHCRDIRCVGFWWSKFNHHSAFVFWNTANVLYLLQILEQDFGDLRPDDQALSHEDKEFLSVMEHWTHQNLDGNYEMLLPFRDKESMCLPNNRTLAGQILRKLKHMLRTA